MKKWSGEYEKFIVNFYQFPSFIYAVFRDGFLKAGGRDFSREGEIFLKIIFCAIFRGKEWNNFFVFF